MAFNCLSELTEKITETDRVARLAQSLLDSSDVASISGELSETKHRRSTANAMTKSALVLLCGYFEGYLKKLIEEFVGELNDLKLPLKSTGDELFLSILQHSITDNRNKTLPKILTIKDCISEDNHFPLTQEAIGATKGNPTVDTVETIFQRIGIPGIIDKLSMRDYSLDSTYTTISQSQQLHQSIELAVDGDITRYQKVVELIDGKWAPKKQRRDVGYVGRIQELLKKRNRIAHGENWGEQVTPTELLDFNQDILRLCTGIDEYLTSELDNYRTIQAKAL
ncbi:MAE_28990/MAE_18760 family HEPN-like nuclease [Pseudomonas sp. F(2018)]|uniref:MAE_28990/MAE_18760 family HEPN-like nuclease n=1 Tax=Pseudomonas sp. F(2018) TaxID=2502240 RepID=UPI0010F6205F|nr:MAE_28990/MAE_18760 family HEPN-like nuclease [Pseudomonas sp. F(2018)]